MLHVQFYDQLTIPEVFITNDVEQLFNELKITGTPQERAAMQKSDGAVYKDPCTMIDRYGNERDISYLSTSCKAILCILNRPDIWVSTIECGVGTMCLIFEICKDGKIVMEDKEVTYGVGGGEWVYTERVGWRYKEPPLEIEVDGEIFTDMKGFNRYADYGRFFERKGASNHV